MVGMWVGIGRIPFWQHAVASLRIICSLNRIPKLAYTYFIVCDTHPVFHRDLLHHTFGEWCELRKEKSLICCKAEKHKEQKRALTDGGDDGEGVQESSGEGPLRFAFQCDVTPLPTAASPQHNLLLVGAYFLSYSRRKEGIRQENKMYGNKFLKKSTR